MSERTRRFEEAATRARTVDHLESSPSFAGRRDLRDRDAAPRPKRTRTALACRSPTPPPKHNEAAKTLPPGLGDLRAPLGGLVGGAVHDERVVLAARLSVGGLHDDAVSGALSLFEKMTLSTK